MRRIAQVVAVLVALPIPARAQDSLDDLDKGSAKTTSAPAAATTAPSASRARESNEISTGNIAEVNGYADNRLSFSWVNPNVAPVPTHDIPTLNDIVEGNVQLKIKLGRKAFVYADVSLFAQGGWLYVVSDDMNGRKFDQHDVASLRPSVVTSELYASYSPAPWLNLLLGKKRIVWGSGVAFNPTDLINPPKDPTDPNFQRSGAWLARVELPFEKFTVSALFAPSVLYQQNGLPYQFLKYPDYAPAESVFNKAVYPDPRDDAFHYLLAARVYALIADTDINLTYFFSNKFNDDFENKSRAGISFSRYFFTDYELHIEALLQQGSPRRFADHYCVNDFTKCDLVNPINNFAATKKSSSAFYPRILIGARTMFRDESTLSIEYYYQGDGYSDLELEDYIRLLSLAKRFNINLQGNAVNGVAPVKFSFDPLRRHYLITSYIKPKIFDDWTVSLVWIASLQDLSGLITPSISWNAREWLTLSLLGFFPIRGIPVGQVDVNGQKYSDYSMFPIDFRVMFETRVFY